MAERDDFFVGWSGRLPRAARGVVAASALGLALGFGGGALAVALTQSDPGDGAIFWGEQVERAGVMVAAPYPHLRMAPSAAHPDGETLLMVRPGKYGVRDFAGRFDGQAVVVKGVWTRRGDVGMIQIGPAITAAPVAATPTPAEDLGRWRLAGEICDGKCYLGAMRPGVGLAHKACANLCIDGGAPPVLVTAEPAEGATFFLLADSDGAALPQDWIGDHSAIPMLLEGRLERRGSLLVFHIDRDKARSL